MRAALSYEIVRLRTLRSTWWLLAISLVLSGGIALALAWASRTNDLGESGLPGALTTGSPFFFPIPAILAALIGVFSFGHEYRYGTIRPTLVALPHRLTVVLAKTFITTVWAALMALLDLGVAWLVIRIVPGQELLADGYPWEPVGRVVVGFVLLLMLWNIVGLALSALLRNLPAALVLLLVFPLIGETIITLVLALIPAFDGIAWWMKYLPFGAGQAMLSVDLEGADEVGFYVATPLQGGLTFGVFAVLLLTLAAVLFRRRDA